MADTETKNTKVVTGLVRFSYAHLFAPRAVEEGQTEKYGVTLLIPKSDKATYQRIKAAIAAAMEVGKSVWGNAAPKRPAIPLYDGDGQRPNGEDFGPECAGNYVITANSVTRPGIVDAALNPIIDQSEFYSGCYGRASINFFAYNKAGKKGIGCGLNNVQKLKDSEPLSGRSTPEDDFADDFKDESDADDLLG